MVERRVCSFCGAEIEPGTGKLYVKKDGTVLAFDSNKCYKNMVDLGRVPRVTPWTRAFKREKGTRLKGIAVEGTKPEAVEPKAEPVAPVEEKEPPLQTPEEPAKAPKAKAPKEEKPKAAKAKKAKKEEPKKE